VTAIPAFHSGIPAVYQPFIPAIAGVLGYFGAGYKSTHQATVSEIEAALVDAEGVVNLFEAPAEIQPYTAPHPLTELELNTFRDRFRAANGIPTDAQIHDYLAEHPERLVSVAREQQAVHDPDTCQLPFHQAPPAALTDTSEAGNANQ
jgi:hypothetical protein